MDFVTAQHYTNSHAYTAGRKWRRLVVPVSALFLAVLFFAACKKSKEEPPVNDLPVFGTCTPVVSSGGMTYSSATGKYTYITSGGGKIEIEPELTIIITHNDYPGFSLELWGSVEGTVGSYNHENLNGKHVKDRVGNRRSIIFPDGAKITFYTETINGPVKSITIYDAGQVHHINQSCNTLEYSASNLDIAKKLDDLEADGEAAVFEFTDTGLVFDDVYTETTAGTKVMERIPIGEIYKDHPDQVTDYWP